MSAQKKQTKNISKKKPYNFKIKNIVSKIRKSRDEYLSRRPHRSFLKTRRRDYARSLKMPGYWAFGVYVRKLLWQQKKVFLLLALTYAIISAIMVGIASQDTYTLLTDTIKETSGDLFTGNWGEVGKASLLFISTISGGISNNLSDVQQVYAALIILMTWLTTVWLLRNILANQKARLRDGLYNASSPLLSTALVSLLLIAQLLPIALVVLGYSAAGSTGLLAGGVEAMLFWIAAILLTSISLYWITSTFIALIVVTLPGMYPMQAIRTAGDLVIGRRIRILLRLLWMALGVAIAWVIVMIPVIIFDTWLKATWPASSWVPIVPIVLLFLSALSVVWISSYIYLLYRRIVADDAAPA
jgi:hypothetical protein